jgi:mutator protein MutT
MSAETAVPARRGVRVVAAVVRREGRLLLTQRPPGGPLGGLWEFPGGKIEPGETAERALAREIAEELGVTASPGEVLHVTRHAYPHGLDVEIVFLACALEHERFTPAPAVHAVRWIEPEAVALDEVLEADREFLVLLGARPS